MPDGSLIFDTTVGTSGFKEGLNDIRKYAEKSLDAAANTISQRSLTLATALGSGIGNVVGNIAGNALNEVVQFFKGSIDTASNLAEVQNVVNTTFENGAEAVNAWAKGAKGAYGLSELAAKRYTSTLGAMFKSSGIASDATLEMSETLTGLSGDMSSFYNINQPDMFEKVRAAMGGETDGLKQLGINMSVANLEAFAMSKGITAAYDKMSQAEQTTLRYNYLLSVTADAQGDFAKTSDGYANQQRILDTTLQELSATIGGTILPIALEATKSLVGLVDGLGDAVEWVSDLLNPPKSELQNEIDAANDSVKDFQTSLQFANKNLDTSLASAKATQATALALLKNYDEIQSKNALTEADSSQLKSLASQIVALYPSMGDAINATTGLFNNNTTAIRNNINALADSQLQAAYATATARISSCIC